MKNTLLILIQFLLFASCSNLEKKRIDNRVLAYVNGVPITTDQVDNKITQEIYDELNRIYLIRKMALDETIKDNILKQEAHKYNLTVEALIDSLFMPNMKNGSLQEFINRNQFDKGIPVLGRSLEYFDIKTKIGEDVLMKRFKEYIINDFIDSLKKSYQISILLKPPISPIIKTENLLSHYKGNLDSKVTLLIVSDFECEMCRKYNYLFDTIYKKYESKIRYGYTNFGSNPTISALASESAAKQNKFWEMHDSLFKLNHLPDSSDIFRIVNNLNMDLKEFRKDFSDDNLKMEIESNIKVIINAGIYATPTIIINNKPLFNSSSFNEIEFLLNNELSDENTKTKNH